MKNYIILVLILLFITSACETHGVIELELPNHQPLFTVMGSLEAGVPVDLIITKSKGILEGNDYPTVKDANVIIIEEGEKAYPLYYFDREYMEIDAGGYTSDELEIKAGKTYELVVSGKNMPTATSTVTIPMPIEIKSYSRADIQRMSIGNQPIVEFSIDIEDPDAKNFYEISFHGKMLNSIYGGQGWIIPTNPSHYKNQGYGQPIILISDANFNAQTVNIGFFAGVELRQLEAVRLYEYHIELKHVTEDYYRYHQTSDLQRETRNDPLAQTVQVHSNIKNGLGTLKAGTATRMRVE